MRAMNAPSEWEEFRHIAAHVAGLGGATALARLGDPVVERKADRSPVTHADRDVQTMILATLLDHFPDHAAIVEEPIESGRRPADPRSSRYCWVVDPIDGTRNFTCGMRHFATSVALLLDGSPVAGAIFDASTGDTYSAVRGGGAFKNDRPLELRDRPRGPDTRIAVSSFRLHPVPPGIRRLLDEVLFRNVGAACLHLAWTAAGFVDAIYAPDIKLWDAAAGALLIAEAGGIVSDENGALCWPVDLSRPLNANFGLLAGTPTAHALVLSYLRAGGDRRT